MRLRRSLAVVAAVVVAFTLGYATRRGGERPEPAAAQQPVLADAVRQVLADRYVRPLDPGALASARTVHQLIAQLRDPFTIYLTSAEYAARRAGRCCESSAWCHTRPHRGPGCTAAICSWPSTGCGCAATSTPRWRLCRRPTAGRSAWSCAARPASRTSSPCAVESSASPPCSCTTVPTAPCA